MIVVLECPALPERLILCSDDEAPELRKKLEQRGNPGRCWNFSEVLDLKAKGVSREEALKLAEARMLMKGGALLWVRPAKKEEEQLTLGA